MAAQTGDVYVGDLRGYSSVGLVEQEANDNQTVDKLVHLGPVWGLKISWTPRTAGVRTLIFISSGHYDGSAIDWVRVRVR